MSKFDEMADRLQADLQKRTDAHKARLREERDAAQQKRETGQRYLEERVVPLLEEARAAFERKKLRVEIQDNWTKQGSIMQPEVRFQVFGQVPRQHDESTYELGGAKALFFHDGNQLRVKVTDSAFTNTGKDLNTEDPNVVEEAIGMAAQSFFKAADPDGRRS